MLKQVLHNRVLAEAISKIGPGKTARICGVWGSSAALAAWAIHAATGRCVLVVATHLDQADEIADDIEVMTAQAAQLFPAWEVDLPAAAAGVEGGIATDDKGRANDEVGGERLRVCNYLSRARENAARDAASPPANAGKMPARRAGGTPATLPACDAGVSPARNAGILPACDIGIVVAPVMALLQAVPSPDALQAARLPLRRGQRLDVEGLTAWLVDAGFDHVEQVDQQGEFAHRGGIVDIFPPASNLAVRVEFFGDEIDSIRRFELDSQRSSDEVDSLDITGYAARSATQTHLLDYLADDAIVIMQQPAEVMELAQEIYRRTTGRADRRRQTAPEPAPFSESVPDSVPISASAASMLPPEQVFTSLGRLSLVEMHVFAPPAEDGQALNLGIRSLERLAINTHEALSELEELSNAATVWVYCENAAEEKRFRELTGQSHPQLLRNLKTGIGHINAGFHWAAEKLVIVGHHEIFHRYAKVRRIRRIRAGRPLESLLDLSDGDYVVHVAHGIAKFEGLRKMERDGKGEEYLSLRFADNALLHVPAGKINLVQKYIGTPAKKPNLSKLGGTGWLKQKQRVEAAVQDMAADMLRVQAMRRAMEGISYPAITDLQRQFVEEFLYQETEDQIRSMQQIDEDMVQPRPMDRLLCGDVGYGKTELAMRSAFKVVEGGKQVAVLVPTTVLADQHFRTFTERFADFPVRIDVLSRFRTAGQQVDVVKRLALGQIDILIGTHRILSKDVKFPDLGLVVIDEEQRFGVEHKEHLKGLRASVDVLTMTATPIPRTLHMSLLGLRDISALSTPPLDRRSIHTQVVPHNDDLLRMVIQRELNRDGQVFYVHNRVMDIESHADHLQGLVPEARIAVGHGQMPEGQLEKIMLRFVRREIDVLVCTTIIESGLDIPTANTMVIHAADRFGLAQLHQLRGRVGRYKHRAFCYLLLPEERPVTPTASKRLKAIEEFSDLGAGFQIAMRDLEIRGAGNILGREQSGHIAVVGYELYCQLLEQAVRELRGEPPPPRRDAHVELGMDAYIPLSYIPAARQRMEIYRRLVKAASLADLKQLGADLADAYGKPPSVVGTLLDLAEIRVLAGELGIDSIIRMDPDIIFSIRNIGRLKNAFDQSIGSMRLADEKTAHWRPPPAYMEPQTLVNVLLNRLRRAAKAV